MKLPVRLRVLAAVLLAAAGVAAGLQAQSGQADPSPFSGLNYRSIGPTNQGGRFVDFAVVEATPQVVYAATASGGLWKTENHGLTWTSIFDNLTDQEKRDLQAQAAGRGGRGGGGRGGGGAADPNFVMGPGAPGTYRVVLSVGGREIEKTVTVMADPEAR